jgi:hypothetical protein
MIIDQIIVEDMERGNRVDIIIEWFPCGGTQSWIGLDSGWNTVVWVTRLDTRKPTVLWRGM